MRVRYLLTPLYKIWHCVGWVEKIAGGFNPPNLPPGNQTLTLRGQGRDPTMFGSHLEKAGDADSVAMDHLGNVTNGYQMVTWPMMSSDLEVKIKTLDIFGRVGYCMTLNRLHVHTNIIFCIKNYAIWVKIIDGMSLKWAWSRSRDQICNFTSPFYTPWHPLS